MGYLIDLLIGVASRFITGILATYMDAFAPWIIEKAAERLPANGRERFREEWLAHLEETTGLLGKAWHVFGCYMCAAKLAKMPVLHLEQTEPLQRHDLLALIDELAIKYPGVRPAALRRLADVMEVAPRPFSAAVADWLERELTNVELQFAVELLTRSRRAPSPSRTPRRRCKGAERGHQSIGT
jgi:hypothetical protein